MVLHLTSSTGRDRSAPARSNSSTSHRHLGSRRQVDRGVHADHDGDFEIAPARRSALQMLPDVPARMQARAEPVRPFELQALVAQVAHPRIRILAHQDAGADVAAGVLRKMPADRQQPCVQLVALHHHFVHRTVTHDDRRNHVRQRMRPGVIEAAGGRADHARDTLAAREQVRYHRARGSPSVLDDDGRRALTLLQLQDQRGREIIELHRLADTERVLLRQLGQKAAQRGSVS